MLYKAPLCQILKKAPWQNDDTRVANVLEHWTWIDEDMTPMSELSESIAEDIKKETECEETEPGWSILDKQ